jgi:hypothetical protein
MYANPASLHSFNLAYRLIDVHESINPHTSRLLTEFSTRPEFPGAPARSSPALANEDPRETPSWTSCSLRFRFAEENETCKPWRLGSGPLATLQYPVASISRKGLSAQVFSIGLADRYVSRRTLGRRARRFPLALLQQEGAVQVLSINEVTSVSDNLVLVVDPPSLNEVPVR